MTGGVADGKRTGNCQSVRAHDASHNNLEQIACEPCTKYSHSNAAPKVVMVHFRAIRGAAALRAG